MVMVILIYIQAFIGNLSFYTKLLLTFLSSFLETAFL